ncbi:hypothetical protein SAMN05444396_10450 [Flavobacterium segetis]|uniref:Uncharacterized protein n=1 Tax=Flavobacterium segetis TaxID=271157 RepID=A0A1M5GNN7_9FLAO|nr:hypothetical protein [Flavobacterium segetis]SHG05287.1 hypothetical protein SAMN05444396_10450 [Flavobacterium segetis]
MKYKTICEENNTIAFFIFSEQAFFEKQLEVKPNFILDTGGFST